MVWYVRIYLSSAVEDELATELARNFGQSYVDKGRNLTEITLYTAHISLTSALNDSINSVNAFLRQRIGGNIKRVEIMTREERLGMLEDQGITEETIKE